MPASTALEVEPSQGGVRLRLRVRAGGRRDAVVGVHGGALKVTVAAAPERGKANRAVERLLAGALDLPSRAVRIVAGHASPDKVVRVEGIDPETLLRRLTP